MGSKLSAESGASVVGRPEGAANRFLGLVLCGLLSACSTGGDSGSGTGSGSGSDGGSGGSGASDGDRDNDGGGGGDVPVGHDIDPPEEGEVIAVLELGAPESEEFVLQGTLPIPPGLFPTQDGSVPFAVVDHDGTPVPSQVEAVTYWPDITDGADVVEILARVRRDSATAVGDRLQYEVVFSPHDAPTGTPSASLATLKELTYAVPSEVRNLLDSPSSVTVRATDCFGNKYEHKPLAASSKQLLRGGRAATQVMTYGTMMPAPAVAGSQGTLPHLFGVHAYLMTWSGEPALSFDLRISNGQVNLDTSSSADDALGKVYFESIEIVVPEDWKVRQAFSDPAFGDPYFEGTSAVYPIVAPLDGANAGKMHVMPFQGQFHRRLMLTPPGGLVHGRALLDKEGQAFCVRGSNPDTGDDYYSWWNPATARYFQQRSLLPSLDHLGLESLRAERKNKFNDLKGILKNGGNKGGYPIPSGDMGWAHPWGVAYGGMTGGDEIQFIEGVETACSASNEGYRYFEVLHRMQTDRQPAAAFRNDGVPTSVEDWLETSPIKHVPFFYYQLANGGSDPFQVNDSPSFQREYVESTGKKPSFHDSLISFIPHDFQHYSRYTRAPMALTWLGNDAISKFDLLASAEVYNLSFHQYANHSNGTTQGSGMLAKKQGIAAKPGVGAGIGRGEGHGTACMNAAYAISGAEWRAAKMPWYENLVDLAFDGQSACNGFLQSVVTSKGLDGKYKVRQAIEQYIFDNAIRGAVETVLTGVNPTVAAMANDFQEKSLYASISELAWEAGHKTPWAWTSVAPLSGAPYCDESELESDWHGEWHEGHNIWASFGYGYWLTADTIFLEFARIASGGPGDALSNLMDQGLNNIDNRASTLAALQLEAGML